VRFHQATSFADASDSLPTAGGTRDALGGAR
jgi:hypothetical protein